MATTEKKVFEGWAILELMGHRRLAGQVTEQEIAGTGFLRIDVPGRDGEPVATQFYAPASVYCLTPTTEAMARAIAVRDQPAPVERWELPALPATEDGVVHELIVEADALDVLFDAGVLPKPEEKRETAAPAASAGHFDTDSSLAGGMPGAKRCPGDGAQCEGQGTDAQCASCVGTDAVCERCGEADPKGDYYGGLCTRCDNVSYGELESDGYPAEIPRARAVAALQLASAILDEDDDAEPADPDGDHEVVVMAETWQAWLRSAHLAVGADEEVPDAS